MKSSWQRSVRIWRIILRTVMVAILTYALAVIVYFQIFNSGLRKLTRGPLISTSEAILPEAAPVKKGRLTRVLSIDGGGVKGLIPLATLKRLEARAGKPIYKLFDVMVGTSTGGIIVMSLTAPDDKGQPE